MPPKDTHTSTSHDTSNTTNLKTHHTHQTLKTTRNALRWLKLKRNQSIRCVSSAWLERLHLEPQAKNLNLPTRSPNRVTLTSRMYKSTWSWSEMHSWVQSSRTLAIWCISYTSGNFTHSGIYACIHEHVCISTRHLETQLDYRISPNMSSGSDSSKAWSNASQRQIGKTMSTSPDISRCRGS